MTKQVAFNKKRWVINVVPILQVVEFGVALHS